MHIEFTLHGAAESSPEKVSQRQVVAELPDRYMGRQKDFINAVMRDPIAQRMVASAVTINSELPAYKMPADLVDLDGRDVLPSQVVGAIIFKTRDRGPFVSYVNDDRPPNFMVYRLAKHLVSIIEYDQQKHVEPNREIAKEYQALKGLQDDLKNQMRDKDWNSLNPEIRAMVSSLNSAVTETMVGAKDRVDKQKSHDNRGRELQYLRAAIEYGSGDGSFSFLDRSVDIEVDTDSVFLDEKGLPAGILLGKVEQILQARFPRPLLNSISYTPMGAVSTSASSERKAGIRIAFTQVEESRMFLALSEIAKDLTSPGQSVPEDITFRGEGNINITPLLNGRNPELVRFRQQIPLLSVQDLNDDLIPDPQTRTSSDLLCEARSFVRNNEAKYEGLYQEWRQTVDPLEAKTRHLSPNSQKFNNMSI
jgi:hypothetical protein